MYILFLLKLISNRFYILIKKEPVSVHGVFILKSNVNSVFILENNFFLLLFVLLGMKLGNSLIKSAFFHYTTMLVSYYLMKLQVLLWMKQLERIGLLQWGITQRISNIHRTPNAAETS